MWTPLRALLGIFLRQTAGSAVGAVGGKVAIVAVSRNPICRIGIIILQ